MGTSTTSGHDHSGNGGCPACAASRKTIKHKVPEKCLVKFRPDGSWKGEYGFDWMREGDTKLTGDVDYRNNVGQYGAKYATDAGAVFTPSQLNYQQLRDGYYDPFSVSWKKTPKGGHYHYLTPWISLFPKNECSGNAKQHKVKLLLEVEVVSKEPDAIKLVYNRKYFKLDKEEITPKSIGKHKIELTIDCIGEFDTDQEIDVVPYKKVKEGLKHQLAGKLMVLANSKKNRYKAEVVFVKVQTKLNAAVKTGSTANEATFLERYFFQSLTSLANTLVTLNLRNDRTFNAQYVIQKDPFTNAVDTFPAGGSNVHTYLESLFDGLYPAYSQCYKVFFFDESGGYMSGGAYKGLNGCARAIPSKSVVLYNTHNTSTTTHELLHAIGLYHSFDNDGDYTYKIGQTENIMDYSHSAAYSNPPKGRTTTWRWQWEILQSNLSNE